MAKEIDKYHRHEVVDRAWSVTAAVGFLLEGHPAVDADPEIKAAFDTLYAAAWDLYKVAGNKYL